MNQRFRKASTVKFVDNAINNEGIIFIVSQERRLTIMFLVSVKMVEIVDLQYLVLKEDKCLTLM